MWSVVFIVGMLFMSGALVSGIVVSRRSARWHQARVDQAVGRVADRLADALGRDRAEA